MKPREQDAPDLEAFLVEHAQWMLRLAIVITGSSADAEDLAQEAALKTVGNWSRVKAADSPRAYLRRVMLNCYLSRRKRPVTVETRGRLPEMGADDAGYDRILESQEVPRLLRTLPPRQQAAVALRVLDDLPYRDIAAALRCREATARSLVRRGLAHLRSELDSSNMQGVAKK